MTFISPFARLSNNMEINTTNRNGNTHWRKLATLLRRAPWLVRSARVLWQVRQAKFSAGVVGVVLDQQGAVLIVEHVFHPYTPWGLPGGWVDRGEDPAQTLKREFEEELQFEIEVGPVLLVKVDLGNHIDMAYLCYGTGAIGQLSSELLDYRWVQPAQLPRLHSFHDRAIRRALELTTG